MKATYRNAAIAAGGALAVAVAAGLLRARTNGRRAAVAQTMTVLLKRDDVLDRLDDDLIHTAVGCETLAIVWDGGGERRGIEWSCDDHATEAGRIALIAAPDDRGTELHLTMHGEKYHVKEIVRKMKMLLETGEIATGARQ